MYLDCVHSAGPVVCPFPLGRRRPTLLVSLLLPCFATQDLALEPDTAQSHSVATQLYPSSTPCYDLAEFDSENSCTAMSCSSVSDVVSVVPVDMLTETSRFAPLSPQCSPVSTVVVDQGVVESPEFDAAVVSSDMSTITSRSTPGCHRYLWKV